MQPIFLVVYDGGDARPYAAAFSTRGLAEPFAAEHDGEVIDTAIDAHACLIQGATSERIGCALPFFLHRVPRPVEVDENRDHHEGAGGAIHTLSHN